ncbi:unnamed protein product [Macrosiphum euphorbiae]|uniref:Uncharacterized protein n=1 Tax=Macrosiphum euphorbiae TaxID=13131 RepID=A0AAV0XY66_9HEMI|nr:unnamed protein product [Macrosiphum euphorbiae]
MRQLEVTQSTGSSTAMRKEESTTLKYLVNQDGSSIGGLGKGEGAEGQEVGAFGLGTRNERGDRLVDFCNQHIMTITNT